MEILFVLDSIEGLDAKLNLLKRFDADIKFFVQAKNVAKLINNKEIIANIVAIYTKNVNSTIDKYLKNSTYKPQSTLLYYSSVDINVEMIDEIKDRLLFQPDTIYVKKKLNWFQRAKLWIYNKIIGLIFANTDVYASVKLQYFSSGLMQGLANTTFKNHIFSVINSTTIELDDAQANTYYAKPKFNKNYLYPPILLCLILICYVVLERFFSLPFAVYLGVVLFLVAVLFTWIVMVVKQTFDNRYRK